MFKTPDVPKPVPQPDMEDIERNKRRNDMRRRQSGRRSTVLTDTMAGDTLG